MARFPVRFLQILPATALFRHVLAEDATAKVNVLGHALSLAMQIVKGLKNGLKPAGRQHQASK